MQEYKSCPFCGCDDIYIKYNGAKHGRFYYVECQLCGGRTRGACRPYSDIQTPDDHEWDCTQAKAVGMLWNRRVTNA